MTKHPTLLGEHPDGKAHEAKGGSSDTPAMPLTVTRFTDRAWMQNTGNGWERPVPYPFYLWSFIGFWRPACVKHRLVFQFTERYYRDHSHCEGGSFPDSDLAIKSGFRKVWLP